MSADGLTGFDQCYFRRGVLFQFLAPEYEIEEPDNKTIGQQQQYWSENRTVENQAVPDVSHFERDQRAGGEDHQKLGPAFLHINADPFGKKHTAIKERHPFEDFEEGDDFEITDATRLLQNCRNVRRITHPPTLRRTLSLRNDWIFAAADFQFVAVGVFKEKAIVSGAVIDADFRAFQILAAALAHEFCNSIYSFAGVRPE